MPLVHFLSGLLFFNNKAIWSYDAQRDKFQMSFFEQPHQIAFFVINSILLLIYFGFTFGMKFLCSQGEESEDNTVSDDFYNECSLKILHTEFYEAQQLILDI